MEAKVDIQKLQLLNDRINQTLEALSQVRASVHGLGHTPGQQAGMGPTLGGPMWGGPAGSYGPQGFGVQPQAPYAPAGIPAHGPPGIQHTGAQMPPYGGPFVSPVIQAPALLGLGGGLMHSGMPNVLAEQRLAEARAADPYRVAYTFPLAFWSI